MSNTTYASTRRDIVKGMSNSNTANMEIKPLFGSASGHKSTNVIDQMIMSEDSTLIDHDAHQRRERVFMELRRYKFRYFEVSAIDGTNCLALL